MKLQDKEKVIHISNPAFSFSFILPVLNESSIINQTIEHIYKIGSGYDFEIIAVDGDPDGSTINTIKNKEIIKLISPKGRGKQMNKGASVAQGDILLFLHTDTELPENTLDIISSIMDKEQYVGGAFDLGIKSNRFIYRVIERMVYFRTRLWRIPYGDQAIFIKKNFFNEIKGFQEIPLMEDVELMRRIKNLGHRIYIIPQKIQTSARRWEKEGVIYCTLRNWTIISLFFLGIHPDKLVKYYYPNWNKTDDD
jgi:rSAM/selenodomain-associated transferase 2